MLAQTPAEQALARSYTTGDADVRFDIDDLSVEHHPARAARAVLPGVFAPFVRALTAGSRR